MIDSKGRDFGCFGLAPSGCLKKEKRGPLAPLGINRLPAPHAVIYRVKYAGKYSKVKGNFGLGSGGAEVLAP